MGTEIQRAKTCLLTFSVPALSNIKHTLNLTKERLGSERTAGLSWCCEVTNIVTASTAEYLTPMLFYYHNIIAYVQKGSYLVSFLYVIDYC